MTVRTRTTRWVLAVGLALAAVALVAFTTTALGQSLAVPSFELTNGWQLILAPLSLSGAAYIGVWAFRLGKGTGQPQPMNRDILNTLNRIELSLSVLPAMQLAQQDRDEVMMQMMRDHEEQTRRARGLIEIMFDRENRAGKHTRSTDV